MSEPQVNDPPVLAEVEAVFARYEQALMSNDVETLDALFWQSPDTVRYGVGENLYGYDEIAAFRVARPGGSPQRTVLRSVVTSFGRDFATTSIEFRRTGRGGAAEGAVGRQSQSWVRLAEGWRIVAAHVSLLGAGTLPPGPGGDTA
ncbi:oxalurate catabolism protein HpxZ [Lichenicoccus sp.]|uniref:oxalurate catabolism protein HpxZ n=1 Tax=Lichenicoccus sp. TaxID=2781899 RepID=UPI003D0E16D4